MKKVIFILSLVLLFCIGSALCVYADNATNIVVSTGTLDEIINNDDVDFDGEIHYAQTHSSGGNIIAGIFLIGVGIFNAAAPRTAWELSHFGKHWMYKDTEPSTAGLTYTRIIGAVVVVLGVVFLLM